MALRLRKDVQKASYYVWFLGAEEARGLRGPRVLLPAIPHLIERSREQEPLKVTLQVSHKGMKIVQGSSKHFITHSAITCSVQAEDIVACVLLLYNPTTKCPLHVHAYRCDSETTAQALHQFLQVLINRPENQKRFSELETRLGLQSTAPTNTTSTTRTANTNVTTVIKSAQSSKRTESSPRRFESSLGSDTGTSTRESECSEELSPTSPTAPNLKASLYDSLAAELRAKLNGNGPPLLLPPRDYDTVHRSKGNLAATELRRCRNSLIVGGPGTKQLVSTRSRGSSGIGSDLAPSPERQDHSSSDDDWINNNQDHSIVNSLPPVTPNRPKPITAATQKPRTYHPTERTHIDRFENDTATPPPPSYLYPREQTISRPLLKQIKQQLPTSQNAIAKPHISETKERFERSSSREEDGIGRIGLTKSRSREEEDIKPIIIRPRNFESRFKHILDERNFDDNDDIIDDHPLQKKIAPEKKRLERSFRVPSEERIEKKRYYDEDKPQNDGYRYREHERPAEMVTKYIDRHEYDGKLEQENFTYRENLTDKQKYRESLMEKHKTSHLPPSSRSIEKPQDQQYYHQETIHRNSYNNDPSSFEKNKPLTKSKLKYENGEKKMSGFKNEATIDRTAYRNQRKSGDKTLTRVYSEKSSLDYDNKMERNPYKEHESLPYRESIDRMMKSPVMRYNSFDDGSLTEQQMGDEDFHRSHNKSQNKMRESSRFDQPEQYFDTKQRYEHVSRRRSDQQRSEQRSPDTVLRVSPKDRFQNAKEKFRAMEQDRNYVVHHEQGNRRMEQPPRRGSLERSGPTTIIQHLTHDRNIDWSSDDEHQQQNSGGNGAGGGGGGRGRPQNTSSGYRGADNSSDRYSSEKEKVHQSSRALAPSKSLGNLVKGYRHSYAEPMINPLPRNSGRVGLAAVNPF